MASPRSELVVLVTAQCDLPRWLGVLQDWSAMGLIRDFVLIDADQPATAAGRPCIAVQEGRARYTNLSVELAGRGVTNAVHVVCISELGASFSGIGYVRGGEIRRAVHEALPAARLTWVHAIAASVPSQWPHVAASELAWVGAHNVVLAPENSGSPYLGVTPVFAADRLRPVGLTHHAAALSSAVGLWVEDPQTLFDGDPKAGGGQMVALRTFSRHLDLDAMQSRLLAKVVDVRKRYPVPSTSDGRPLQRVLDGDRFVEAMVDGLWERHEETRSSKRRQVEDPTATDVSFMAAIAMFLRFFGNVLRGAPKAMLDAMHHEIAVRVAGASQSFIFGRGQSGYVLTVNGVRGVRSDGTVIPPAEVDEGLDRLIGQLRGDPGATPSERFTYPMLWKDLLDGAFTLLDAAPRNDALPVPRVGAEDAVVTDPAVVAPDPAVAFPVPPELRAILQVDEIAAHDDDLARTAFMLLGDRAETQREKASQYQALQEKLRAWFETPRHSYVGSVGRRLSGELTRVREEVVGLVEALSTVDANAEVPDGWGAIQKQLGRTLFLHMGIYLAVIAVFQLLAFADLVDWAVALGAIPVIIVMWLVTSTVVFMRRQRRLFQALNERRAGADQAKVMVENLAAALVDLRRIQSIYRQYLHWARVLGTFVREPWGTVVVAVDGNRRIGEGFGLNHRFGVPSGEEGDLDELSRRIQSRLYRVGWLTGAWDAFVEDLPDFEDRHVLEGNPDLLYSNVTVSDRPLLEQWSEAVTSRTRVDAAKALGDRARDLLRAESSEMSDRLVRSVRVSDTRGQTADVALAEFLGRLDQVEAGTSEQGRFSVTIFAETAAGTPWRVGETQVTEGRHDGRALIVTQVSASFAPQDLRAGHVSRSVDQFPTPPAPDQLPPQV